jgi:hypothetical protein
MRATSFESDRDAVLEVVHRYFACLDEHDAEGLRECLATDLRAGHSLLGVSEGLENFLAVLKIPFPGLLSAQHYCSNERISVEGDRAACHAYLYAQHVVERDGVTELMPGGAHYEFDLARDDGRWRIRELRNRVTWMTPGLEKVFTPPG